MEDNIYCPLVSDSITPVDCMENRDIKEECIPEKFKVKPDWKEICKNCEYQKY